MGSGETRQVTVVVTPLLGRTLISNVKVTPDIPDSNNSNNSASNTVRVRFIRAARLLGYTNNKLNHTIEIDAQNAAIAKRVFELYATGNYSLAELRKAIRTETGKAYQKGYLHKISNPSLGS